MLLDCCISSASLCEFIDGFYDAVNEQQAWQFWLHRNTGRSWEDFRLAVLPQDIDTVELMKNTEDIENSLTLMTIHE